MKRGLVLLFLIVNWVGFGSSYTISDIDKIINVDFPELYIDSTNSLEIDEIISKEFEPSELSVPNIKGNASIMWAKFSLNSELEKGRLLIQVEYPLLSYVSLYRVKDGVVIDSATITSIGKYSNREFKSQFFVFDSKLKHGKEYTYYAKFESYNQTLLPIKVGTVKRIFEESTIRDLIFGLYFGIVVVMILYNLFIYFSVRDRSYIYYVLYISAVGLTQAIFNGYAYKYLWPENEWLSVHALPIVGSLSGIFMGVFAIDFLKLKQFSNWLVRIYLLCIFFYSIAILTSLLNYNLLSFNLTDLMAGIATLYTFFVAVFVALKKYRPGKFFLIAWVVFLVGVFVFVMRNFGVLPYNDFTNYTMPLGSAFEMVLLSFALADRINTLKKEKEESQKKALTMAQENERIIIEQNVVLEQKVDERTKELKESQAQLVHAEKMASLGQLTAGVAHEINNPMNFATQRIQILERDMEDINSLLSKYDSLLDDSGKKEIADFKKSIDFEIVKEEIGESFEGLKEGVSRALEISKSLKDFSRLDESVYKKANVNDGIKSTVKMLANKIAENKVELVIDLDSNVPEIECSAGKLNQVFMNVIDNAIDSMSMKLGESGLLKISSRVVNNLIELSFEDNGVGIPKEIQDKLFDPFFTTKDVGKGTGLGMSISLGIIEEHKGKIEIESKVGEGATIQLFLPIN